MDTGLSLKVSRLLTEAIDEVRRVPRLDARRARRLSANPDQMALLPDELEDTRHRFSLLVQRFERTTVGRQIRDWGAESKIDAMIFLAAIACECGGLDLNWPTFFATYLDDPVQRLVGMNRVRFFSGQLYGWKCALKDEVLAQILGDEPDEKAQSFVIRKPQVDLDSVVIEPDVRNQLVRLRERLTASSTVLEAWGLARVHRSSIGGGALFYGPPGTGKTLAAEAIAASLGLDFFVLDGAGIQSKWVGETEKNLKAVFQAADKRRVLLFIDEADGLLGHRTTVTRSTDAFRNNIIETLLLFIERRVGPTILASNFEDALDAALRRRLSTHIEFPRPTRDIRGRLWAVHIPAELPLAQELDFDQLAEMPLTGAEISQAVLMAASHAAAEGRAVAMSDLVEAALPWVPKKRHLGFGSVA